MNETNIQFNTQIVATGVLLPLWVNQQASLLMEEVLLAEKLALAVKRLTGCLQSSKDVLVLYSHSVMEEKYLKLNKLKD